MVGAGSIRSRDASWNVGGHSSSTIPLSRDVHPSRRMDGWSKRRAPRGDGRSERVCEVCATVGEGKEVRILLIGSDNPWRMENALERAMQRAGHTTLLIDDRRMKRLIGWKLTQ